MVNKKGFLRTLESIIAIIMVLGLILYVTPTRTPEVSELPGVVEQAQNLVLEEVAVNKEFRKCILESDERSCIGMNSPCSGIESFIQTAVPTGYQFNCEICSSSIACVSSLSIPQDKTVYTRDTFVAGSPSKVFRVYMWQV